MYLPTASAPASRLLALGEFLLVALRASPTGADLAPFLERRCEELAAASARSTDALRAVTPHRVAHRFAEQRLALAMIPLSHEAHRSGLPLRGESRVARAEELLLRIEVHPDATVRARCIPPVRDALREVSVQLAACTLAFDRYETVLAEEVEARTAFVKLYGDIAKELGNRMPETMRAAFFDDPCTRRAGARVEDDVESAVQAPMRIAA